MKDDARSKIVQFELERNERFIIQHCKVRARQMMTSRIASKNIFPIAFTMTGKARKLGLWTIAGIATIAVLLLHFKQRDSYRCQICFSKRDVFQWRIGFWMGSSIPLTPQQVNISETKLLEDYFPSEHIHDWKFAQGSPYHFFGTTWGGCALGGGRHVSNICQMYERSDEFRGFIRKKIEDGSLTKSNFLAPASNPDRSKGSHLQLEAESLVDSYFER